MSHRQQTIDRLMQVKARVLELGKQGKFDMASYLVLDGGPADWNRVKERVECWHECGTAACIGGTALLLWPEEVTREDRTYGPTAARILGLTDREADELFDADFWEEDLMEYYDQAYDEGDGERMARAGAAAIDRLIRQIRRREEEA
jgi:hypothetical protein